MLELALAVMGAEEEREDRGEVREEERGKEREDEVTELGYRAEEIEVEEVERGEEGTVFVRCIDEETAINIAVLSGS